MPVRRLLTERRRHRGRRRIGAHAAGVGPGIAFAHRLVILRRLQRQHGLTVDQGEVARLLAYKHLLDHELGAGLAEGAAQHSPRRIEGFGLGLRQHDTLAGGEPVRLDHQRCAQLGDERLSLRERGNTLVGGGAARRSKRRT